jgi:hypothetical protein
MCTVCHCLIPVSGLTHMSDDGAFHPVIPQDMDRLPLYLSAPEFDDLHAATGPRR